MINGVKCRGEVKQGKDWKMPYVRMYVCTYVCVYVCIGAEVIGWVSCWAQFQCGVREGSQNYWVRRKEMEIANAPVKHIFDKFSYKEELGKYLVCREDFFKR